MNLRSDDRFVQDEGWYRAAQRYEDFLRRHRRGKVLYLELGVGYNTPVIIKYPFWQLTAKNPDAVYACINLGQAECPGRSDGAPSVSTAMSVRRLPSCWLSIGGQHGAACTPTAEVGLRRGRAGDESDPCKGKYRSAAPPGKEGPQDGPTETNRRTQSVFAGRDAPVPGAGSAVSHTVSEQRRLLRSLMNLRPPMPLDPAFLRPQDKLLSTEREEKRRGGWGTGSWDSKRPKAGAVAGGHHPPKGGRHRGRRQ